MKMRRSKVLAKMRAGEVANCIKLNLCDPRVADLIGMLGFDCIWLCHEHITNTLKDTENIVRAAKMHDMDTMVRVAKGSYSDYIYPFEMDAAGIMVPHVMTGKEALEIAYNTRFHPIGRRAWDGGNADGAYCMIPPLEYIEQANRERFVIVQIEDPEALDEIDKIAQVDGIDMLLFGPGDFSQGLGKPAQYDAPEIADARKRVAEVARKHGKFAGTTGSIATFEEFSKMGYQFINVSADVIALTKEFIDIAKELGISKDSDDSKSIYGK